MNTFLFGLTSGLTVLTLTGYRRVSPKWLKWLLIAVGGLVISLYLIEASGLMLGWLDYQTQMAVHVIGLTLPCVFAIDQLIRHPAITPKKLLRWYSPFALLCLVAGFPIPSSYSLGRAIGRGLAAYIWLLALYGLFVICLIAVCALLMRKLPSSSLSAALVGLTLGQTAVVITTILTAWWLPSWSVLIAVSVAWVTLWYAFETGTSS